MTDAATYCRYQSTGRHLVCCGTTVDELHVYIINIYCNNVIYAISVHAITHLLTILRLPSIKVRKKQVDGYYLL